MKSINDHIPPKGTLFRLHFKGGVTKTFYYSRYGSLVCSVGEMQISPPCEQKLQELLKTIGGEHWEELTSINAYKDFLESRVYERKN